MMRRKTATRTIRKRCSDMKEIFLLSCAEVAEGGGVYKFGLTKRGKLERISYLPCPKPMYSVLHNGRLHILLRSPFEASGNSGYFSCREDLSDYSTLENTLGKCACHLSVDEDVYIANYLSGNIVKNCEESVTHTGKGVNQPRQDAAHTHFTAFSPDEEYVLCCDLGLDTVYVYDRNLKQISAASVPAGYGVRHLVFSKDGRFFYAVNELVPSVSVFAYANGEAKYMSTTLLDCENKNSTAAAIRSDDEEGKIYISVRGKNKIFVFDVCGETLRLSGSFSCGGSGPRDFNLTGKFIVCANENSDNITVIDKKTYCVVEDLPMKNPLNVVMGK